MSRADSRRRYREIAGVLGHYGFEWLWSDYGIGKILGDFERRHGKAPGGHTQPERLRLALEELGTTFIKIGQMLSTRADLVPADYVAELSKLQDHAPEVPFADVVATLDEAFGGQPESFLRSIDTEPRAAGSIAQVHSALLPDGTHVVVKIRLPGIELQVEQDLAILGQIARFLAHNTELGKKLDVEGLGREFAYTLRNELDSYGRGRARSESAPSSRTKRAPRANDLIGTSPLTRCLTMEDIQGIKIDDLAALDAAGIDRKALAKRCAHIALVQVLDHGFFHADPHPGNFFVYPDGSVALIDYGMIGRVDDRMRESLVRLALAVSRDDSDRLIDELLTMEQREARLIARTSNGDPRPPLLARSTTACRSAKCRPAVGTLSLHRDDGHKSIRAQARPATL